MGKPPCPNGFPTEFYNEFSPKRILKFLSKVVTFSKQSNNAQVSIYVLNVSFFQNFIIQLDQFISLIIWNRKPTHIKKASLKIVKSEGGLPQLTVGESRVHHLH